MFFCCILSVSSDTVHCPGYSPVVAVLLLGSPDREDSAGEGGEED